jgi:AcrR family transcriptional regulator
MKSESRRKDILDAFEKLVHEYGIDKTTMHDVAREMKISVGLLYTEFSGKDDLVEGLLERIHFDLIEFNDDLGPGKVDVVEKLREALVGKIEKYSINTRKSKVIFDFLSGKIPTKYLRNKIDANHLKIREGLLKRIEQILTLGVLEKKFEIDNIPLISRVLFDAFESYRFPPLLMNKEHDILMKDAETMFELFIKSIKSV